MPETGGMRCGWNGWTRALAAALLTVICAPLAARAGAAEPAPTTVPLSVTGDKGTLPLRLGGEVKPPTKIFDVAPVYTETARRARIQGVVIIECVIDEHGRVIETKVLKGLPMGLDSAAVEAVKRWLFRPATVDGKPVPVYFIVTVSFRMATDLAHGPLLGQLMAEHPELGERFRARDYTGALALVDGWAATPAAASSLAIVQTYALIGLERPADAWTAAQAYRGGDPGELYVAVGEAVQRDLAVGKPSAPQARAAILEVGLAASAAAISARPKDAESCELRGRLLMEKARLSADAAERDELQQEASELLLRANQLRPAIH